MAFFKKLKAAFGFGDYETDEELSEKFLPYEAQHRTPYINPFKKEDNVIAMEETEKETEKVENKTSADEIEDLPVEMYNGVLSIINSTIPTFVRECLNVEAEKRAIAKALGPHIKNAMQRARQQIMDEASKQWEKERGEMTARVEQSEMRCKEASERVEQAQTKMQSAEAQRKSMTERCRSLESRIAELEAECEQYELENKSLVNKIKVAQVHAEDLARYQDEIEGLRKQLADVKEHGNPEAEAKWSGEVAKLQQEIATKDADIDALSKKEAETASQLAAAREELNEALATLDIANEVQMQVDRLSDQIKARDAKIASLRELYDKKEAEAARNYNEVNNANLDLKLKYDLLNAEAQKLRDAVANAEKDKEEAVAEVHELLVKAEKDNGELEKRIEALKQDAAVAQKRANTVESEREERFEDMKKQLETAAGLIAERDSAIKQLNDKISAMEGEMSYARVSESENRLKIRKLSTELEAEKEHSKQLAEQLAAMNNAADSAGAGTQKKNKPGRPRKSQTVAEVEAPVAVVAPEPASTIPSVDSADSTPEPELEEAVKHVFKIDISDTAVAEAAQHSDETVGVEGEESASTVGEAHGSEELLEVEQGAEHASLPIDNTVMPVEPIDNKVGESSADFLGDEGNIDTTFETSGNDIPDLDDEIEWLMPATAVADDREAAYDNGDEKEIRSHIEKEEPRQQQMSLF